MSTQMRLGFSHAQVPVTVDVVLSGLVVLAESESLPDDALANELSLAGIVCEVDGAGVRFGVDQMSALSGLGEHFKIVADDTLTPLLDLIAHPSDEGVPADVTVDGGGLEILWQHAGQAIRHPLPSDAATALLASDLPFVASAAAFDTLACASRVPVLVGRAHVNLDGFVEIVTSKPQLAESAPIPGLFRLDATRLGCALPYANQIATLPGFRWSAPPPEPDLIPDISDELSRLPMPLSAHAAADVHPLVVGLSQWRSQAVVWRSGLGRRVFVTATLSVLDAFPTLVVCHPEHVWLWFRHAALAGKTARVADGPADIHIVTYEQLAAMGGWTRSVQAVVFDSPDEGVRSPAVAAAASRLGPLSDAYRVVVASHWPHDPVQQQAVMRLLRPAEFPADVSIPMRYPPDSYARFSEHVNAYVSRRDTRDTATDLFRTSSVQVLPPVPAQVTEWERIRAREGSAPAVMLANLMEVTSAGTDFATSPKVAAAVSAAGGALDNGRRVLIVTRHQRSAQVVSGLLRPRKPFRCHDEASLRAADTRSRLGVATFDRVWPDVSFFDDVIVMDWPWSFQVMEHALGSASSPSGPATVTVLHTPGSVDDRLVLAAAHRGGGHVNEVAGPPGPAQIAWLLSPGL